MGTGRTSHPPSEPLSLEQETYDVLVLDVVVEAVHAAVRGKEVLLPGYRGERLELLPFGPLVAQGEYGFHEDRLTASDRHEPDVVSAVESGIDLVSAAHEFQEHDVLDRRLTADAESPPRGDPLYAG